MQHIEDVTNYNENFISKKEADELFEHLMGFEELTTMMEIKTLAGDSFKFDFGKTIFLDKELKEKNKFPEAVWGKNKVWTKKMLAIKTRVENYINEEFKTCVCIFYPDGNSGVEYHSDKPAFGDTAIIPAISLGEERQFCLRENKTMQETCITLKHGSLLIMKNGCQENFQHSLPTNNTYKNPRISLTFRKFGFDDQL
ncbi:alpha-ketoglutarate-dependent dioxygenase AlkB [Aequorivita sp. F47161]|uniref:Alpha-ketoglutarate-dependent dioxygenase AlkB n=1 Tax=Aequorivita vitellina TaxID=2874475 RepID=A0A9X1QTH1_9FLAO|nr:alpha-ketoglutarate-dependent dioxygenase AlkB [Aequorivita vitellina]MCG2418080.1 alpha-ketoglutarate-dependent dioxygenase AlkB [Aequorivita vitellina]